jgi:hypothetical protein
MDTDWKLARDYKELPNLLKDIGDFEAFESGTGIFSYSSNVLHPCSKNKTMVDALTRSGQTDYFIILIKCHLIQVIFYI